jgi:large subunit ribosomal protein L6
MSRIGEKPIAVPDGVEVRVSGRTVNVKGKLGELSVTLPGGIEARVEEATVVLTRPDDTRQSKSFHGLGRSLVANMVEGVANGYTRELEISGVGYRASVEGQKVEMLLGFSSPVVYEVPEGVTVKVDNQTKLTVSGADKQKVGAVAARLRGFSPAEPYKGKGVQYKGEQVRRKVGKTVA